MAQLIISTLGTLQISDAQSPLAGLLSDKVRALLVYLAVEQTRPFRREALAALFWPDQPESNARANLRRALANLRRVIGDENGNFLHITRQSLQFNSASSACVDAVQFRQLLRDNEPNLAQMEEAVALVNGRFLAGFSVHGSIAFEEWALLKREQIQRQLLHTLNLLTAYYEDNQQPQTAVEYAWQQVNVEPWFEPGQRQLMRLLAQTRQRSAAIAHYEQFRDELSAELAVAPEPATRRLYDALCEGQYEHEVVSSSPTFLLQSCTMSPTPFVARGSELAQLNCNLQAAVSGQGQVVFITGEAGSGKTALLQTFAQQAQAKVPDLIPLFGECQAHIGHGSPYLPLRALLARAVGDIESQWHNGALNRHQANRLWSLRHTAVQLLQDEAPDLLANLIDSAILPAGTNTTSGTQAPSQALLFQQTARFLQKFSRHGPLLLLLDDLHWIDQGTVDLLFHLRHQMAGFPIMLVGSYRPEEMVSDSSESGPRHPLAPLLHELQRDFGEIEVALDRADGRSFVDVLLDSEPNHLDESFRQTLFEQTQGHALFTVELVAGMRERGELVADKNGFWLAGEKISWQRLPAKVEAIVAERIGRLPQSLRQLLDAASVQGETFAAEIAALVLDRRPREVIHLMSGELARTHCLLHVQGRQLLGEQPLSGYRFRHSLFQQYIYDCLDGNEKAYLHQSTAEQLETVYTKAGSEPMGIAAQLAYHFANAQATAKAAHYHHLAGQQSLRLSSNTEAIVHFRQSLDLLSAQPEAPEQVGLEIESLLALGAALLAIQGYTSPEVKQVYDRAYTLCLQVDAAPELVSALFWLTSYYAVSGELENALVVAREMLAIIEKDPVSDLTRIQAHVLTGLPLFFMGRIEEALAHFELGSVLYDPKLHQPHIYTFGQDPGIASMVWQGHALLHMGKMEVAKECLQQALTWTDDLDHPYTVAFSKLMAGCAPCWYFGQFNAGIKYAQDVIKIANEEDFALMQAYGLDFMGQMIVYDNLSQANEEAQQKVAEGIDLMLQGMEMEQEIGAKMGVSSRWIILADTYCRSGQIELAWQAVRRADHEVNERGERYFEAKMLHVKGELYHLAGEELKAKECWKQVSQVVQKQKAYYWEVNWT